MLTATEIKEVKFSRAMGGYKADEVEVLLDKVEADYAAFERIIKDYELRVETLNSEIEGFKNSQSSIQNVLVSAQTLADSIVKEAKEKSEEIIKQAESNIINITTREKELSAAFELKAQEQKNALEKELNTMVADAQAKSDAITTACEERVKHQQMLFDRLKLEIAAFKSTISAKYKEHLEQLTKLPDTVPADPEYIAKVISSSYDKTQEEKVENEPVDISSDTVLKTDKSEGFTIENPDTEEDV